MTAEARRAIIERVHVADIAQAPIGKLADTADHIMHISNGELSPANGVTKGDVVDLLVEIQARLRAGGPVSGA